MYTKPNDVWSLRFKLEVFIWHHFVNMPTSSTTFCGILICVIFRPGICKNIFLCSVLHWRIIRIKRFFSGVHACIHGADALTNFTWTSFGHLISLWVHRHHVHMHELLNGRLCKVCECIATVYTCMNSWKEAFNPIMNYIWYCMASCYKSFMPRFSEINS